MCYMMSRAGYLNDALGHHVPHLMFYFPLTDKASWGADLPDSPVTLNPQFQGRSGAHYRVRDSGWKMVGWNGCTGYVGKSRGNTNPRI